MQWYEVEDVPCGVPCWEKGTAVSVWTLLNEIFNFRKTREMFQVVRIPLLKTRFDPPSSLSFGRSESKKVVNKDGNLRRHKESAALELPAPSSGYPTRTQHSPDICWRSLEQLPVTWRLGRPRPPCRSGARPLVIGGSGALSLSRSLQRPAWPIP
uniref:Uncharacterized protein n=1 Tax=Rangifer tarandus platyrhynchus TaxID=3082113 RepID=A0ACB0FM71_RANTA|nr:unnamed protein product [Rangifer tarandus platyrhynchus]